MMVVAARWRFSLFFLVDAPQEYIYPWWADVYHLQVPATCKASAICAGSTSLDTSDIDNDYLLYCNSYTWAHMKKHFTHSVSSQTSHHNVCVFCVFKFDYRTINVINDWTSFPFFVNLITMFIVVLRLLFRLVFISIQLMIMMEWSWRC